MIADDIGAAVETELNQTAWVCSFQAEHVQDVKPILEGDTDLRVLVYDAGLAASRAARGRLQKDVQIIVSVEQRVTDVKERVKILKGLADDIVNHFAFADVGHQILLAELVTHRSYSDLHEKGIFTAIIRLTYRTWYAKP